MMLVKQIQNALSFAVCVYTTYNVYRYNTRSDESRVTCLSSSLYVILAYLIVDLVFYKMMNLWEPVVFFHHACVIVFIAYTICYIEVNLYSVEFPAMEISTVFLIIRVWLKELSSQYKKTDTILPNWLSVVEPVNNMLFIVSFTYFRIYLFSKTIIFGSKFETDMSKYRDQNPMFYYIFRTSIYFMYALNIYWFSLILKSLSRSVKGCRFLSARNCEWALQYTYTLSLMYAIYKYSALVRENPVYCWDILGYALVSISSYLYHGALYRYLVAIYPSVNFDKLDAISFYLFDVGCINLRTWLTSYTHYNVIPGYLTSNGPVILSAIAVSHVISFGLYSWYVCDMKRKHQIFDFDTKDFKMTVTGVIIGVPIIFGVLFNIVNNYGNYDNSDIFYNMVSLATTIYICGLILQVAPFYQMNHFVLHVFLLFTSVILVRNNIPLHP